MVLLVIMIVPPSRFAVVSPFGAVLPVNVLLEIVIVPASIFAIAPPLLPALLLENVVFEMLAKPSFAIAPP